MQHTGQTGQNGQSFEFVLKLAKNVIFRPVCIFRGAVDHHQSENWKIVDQEETRLKNLV